MEVSRRRTKCVRVSSKAKNKKSTVKFCDQRPRMKNKFKMRNHCNVSDAMEAKLTERECHAGDATVPEF